MLSIGGVTLGVRIDERWAGAVRSSAPYRVAASVAAAIRGRREDTPVPGTERRTLDVASFPSAEARAIAERVNAHQWYHSIELPCGVTTPGLTDHRSQLAAYGLPDDMRGMRALDIATFDGFWAFEMERRGAQVVAVDIPRVHDADIPLRTLEQLPRDENHATGGGFRLAHELLGSRVERREMSVYAIEPDVLGTFDVVFMSDLLLHLRDPQRALERAYSVVRDSGYALVAEPHNPALSVLEGVAVQQLVGYDRYVWSIPSAELLRRMLNVAGFGEIEELSRFQLNYRGTFPLEKLVFRAYPWQRRLLSSEQRNGAALSVVR
jgi:tRNA (mo5U34)-methyltransferase